MTAAEISPIKKHTQPDEKDLLTIEVKTWLEKQLQEELVVKDVKITYIFEGICPAITIANGLATSLLCKGATSAQGEGKEAWKEREEEWKDNWGKKGWLLTSLAVFNLVDEYETARDAEEAEREAHKQKNLDFAVELAEWTKEEEKRVKRNEVGLVRWQAALDNWNKWKKEAKAACRKVKEWEKGNPKPKKTDPEYHKKAVPKPKKKKKNSKENDKERESN